MWRTGHKLAWDVLRNCHTYMVEEVLAVGVANLEASLLLRFHGFFRGLLASPSHEVVVEMEEHNFLEMVALALEERQKLLLSRIQALRASFKAVLLAIKWL